MVLVGFRRAGSMLTEDSAAEAINQFQNHANAPEWNPASRCCSCIRHRKSVPKNFKNRYYPEGASTALESLPAPPCHQEVPTLVFSDHATHKVETQKCAEMKVYPAIAMSSDF